MTLAETQLQRRPTLGPGRAVATVLAAVALSCSPQPDAPLLAGAAAVDITPRQWPLPMIGSFSYRPADSAHDPLKARAIALRRGGSTAALAAVDSCYIPRETIDRAKLRVEEATGLDHQRILVAATHTHSAPPSAPGAGLRGLESEADLAVETAYVDLLVEGIASAIIESVQALEPAEVGWASAMLPDEVFNRRWYMKEGAIPPDPFGGTTDRVKMNPPRASPDLVRPSGPVDPEVAVVSIRAIDGRPIAVLANYSLHYVGGIPSGQVSADYFGEFTRIIEERVGTDGRFVAILSNGTSGNINNIDFSRARAPREPFEQVRLVAAKLADTVTEALGEAEYQPGLEIDMAQSELELKRRKPSPEVLRRSKELLASPPATATVRQRVYARRAIDLEEGPDQVAVVLQAMRIGPIGIVALPFETFVETGLSIKRRSPLQPSFVIELANGAEGYLPTPEHHELGGYETWLGTSRVEEQASVLIEEELIDLLEHVAN